MASRQACLGAPSGRRLFSCLPQNLRQLTKILQRRVLFVKSTKNRKFFCALFTKMGIVQTLQNTFYRTSLFLENLETIKNSPFRMKYAASFAPQPENLPRYVICADVPKTQPPPAPGAASVPNKSTAKCLYLKNTRLSHVKKNPQKRQASAGFFVFIFVPITGGNK